MISADAFLTLFDCKWVLMANSADLDEMPQHVAFHQSLHCLPQQKQSPKVVKQ